MNFIDILQKYQIPYKESGQHHHVSPGWIGIDCIWCSRGSQKFKLGYNLAGSYLSCWTCGNHSLPWTLAEVLQEPYPVVKELLGDLDREEQQEQQAIRKGLKLPEGLGPRLKQHDIYLRSRGFDPEKIWKLWGVLGIGLAAKLAWRLWIPIKLNGITVSWTTRSTGLQTCGGLRYISAKPEQEAIHHKTLLYGEDYCKHAIVICEGPTDVWRIGPGAVATFGTGYSRAQVLRMSKYPVRAICFDSDPRAQDKARRLGWDLRSFPGETHLVTLNAVDPGSADVDEVNELRRRFLD